MPEVERPIVLMIELDGAEWSIINRMLDNNELPNIGFLIEHGVSASLRSIPPLISPALWTTIMTGKERDKHGVVLFGDDARSVRAKRIWEIASDHGRVVGVYGSMVTWPPRKLNGFLIPDIFARGAETYPPEYRFLQELTLDEKEKIKQESGERGQWYRRLKYLLQLLKHGLSFRTIRHVGGYIIRYELIPGSEFLDTYWRKVLLQAQISSDIFIYLFNLYKPDFSTFHFHATDTLAHKYWQYMNPQGFTDLKHEDVKRYRGVVASAYREADHFIGRMLSKVGDYATLMVLSDHGMRGMEASLVKYELQIESLLQLLQLEETCVPAQVGFRWYLHLTRDATNVQNAIEILGGTIVKETGQRVFEGIHRFSTYITFITSSVAYDGFLEQTLVVPGVGEMSASKLFQDSRGVKISGTHSEEGVFILYGPAVRRGVTLNAVSILDIAPTTLALLGMPIARDMEGNVLVDALKESFLETYPIKYIDTYEDSLEPHESPGMADLSAQEVEALKERLRNLGYL